MPDGRQSSNTKLAIRSERRTDEQTTEFRRSRVMLTLIQFDYLLLFGLLIGIACAMLGFVVWRVLPDWTTRGQFGDMFGVVNTLFSGGALAGVIYAVLLQRRELQLQRQELGLTRRELERTAGAQEQSAQRLLEQTTIQTNLLNAQLVKDRLQLYWETYKPVTAEQLDEFKLYPQDYMELALYEERYKSDDSAIRRYIYMSQLYEYLAFTHSLQSLNVPDPLGEHWVATWTRDLSESSEFLDVNEQYGEYYPAFKSFVERMHQSVLPSDGG